MPKCSVQKVSHFADCQQFLPFCTIDTLYPSAIIEIGRRCAMAEKLDPQVQVKLIEISKEWAEKVADHTAPAGSKMPKGYPKEFDNIYKQLVKTMSGE